MLVVEDDPAIGLDLRMALTRVGAVIVGPAGSVAAAFAALADQAVDAAILDIRLKNNELSLLWPMPWQPFASLLSSPPDARQP